MIIRGFNASNLLKYKTLHLPDLPERGLIGISGANESGKSAIVEAPCLALYGRTFAIPAGRLDKLVRWGEQHAEVSLQFETGGERYPVTRYIDADANHSASLKRGDDQDNLASGDWSWIGGGDENVAGPDTNGNVGGHASVSGGRLSHASGNKSSISGGRENTATGVGASVSGGYRNTVTFGLTGSLPIFGSS